MRRHLAGLLERAAVLQVGRNASAAEGVVAAGRPGATAHHSPSIVSVEPLTIELRLPTTVMSSNSQVPCRSHPPRCFAFDLGQGTIGRRDRRLRTGNGTLLWCRRSNISDANIG